MKFSHVTSLAVSIFLSASITYAAQSQFHPDKSIPSAERAELRNYARSGYDRGHVAPSADMFDMQSQHESFSLANMVPQEPSVNRRIWGAVELTTRKLTKGRVNCVS